MSTPELFQTLSQYNRWMNDKLYACAARLTDEERKADRSAFFGSLHSTLNHLLFADRAWMSRLTGREYESAPLGEDIYEDFETLRTERTTMDAEIIDWCKTLETDWLAASHRWVTITDGRERTQPRWLLVTHMFNHQTHHRGQATTLLTQMGQDVGVTDLPKMFD